MPEELSGELDRVLGPRVRTLHPCSSTARNMAPRESQLARLIDERCDKIIEGFVRLARTAGASDALPDEVIVDSLRDYLIELSARLREEWSRGAADLESGTIAAAHGEHRFLHGYDLAELIREYGALKEVLWDVIVERGDVPLGEIRILFKHLLRGVAEAAAQYTLLRDAELRKQTAEHVAFLAHEVRNPISSALLAISIIRAQGDVRSSPTFDALDRGLRKAAQLIDDSLVTLRLRELGELDRTEVEVAELVREIATDSAAEAAAKELWIDVDGEGKLEADPKALRSAISNLVRNAVKFSKAGGEVHVRIRPLDARLVIEIEDSCGGLPEGAEKKLFDPFVQAGADRSGFGLGLAIAKQATEAHKGQLRVHDLPGKGCVFVLDLPRSPPRTEERTATPTSARRTR